jgi:hypothetical protein
MAVEIEREDWISANEINRLEEDLYFRPSIQLDHIIDPTLEEVSEKINTVIFDPEKETLLIFVEPTLEWVEATLTVSITGEIKIKEKSRRKIYAEELRENVTQHQQYTTQDIDKLI